jgi:Tol biopolymer transport system component
LARGPVAECGNYDTNETEAPDASRSFPLFMNPDGSGQHALTRLGVSADPSWSRDGRRIAFDGLPLCRGASLYLCRGGHWEIYVMNADGSG